MLSGWVGWCGVALGVWCVGVLFWAFDRESENSLMVVWLLVALFGVEVMPVPMAEVVVEYRQVKDLEAELYALAELNCGEVGTVHECVDPPVTVPHRHPRAVQHSSAPPPTVVGENVEQWRGLVASYFPAEWVEWALRVMQCESGGNPNAFHSGSKASGLFQHLQRYWADRSSRAGWGGADIFDPEANIAVAAWLLANGGTSHWVCKAAK